MSPFINWLQNIHECHQMGKKTKLNFCSAIYSILCTCWCWWKHCQLFSCTVYLFGWFYAFICLFLVALFCIEAFFVNLFVAQFFVAVLVLYENVFFVYQFLFWRFWLCAWSFFVTHFCTFVFGRTICWLYSAFVSDCFGLAFLYEPVGGCILWQDASETFIMQSRSNPKLSRRNL